MKVPEHYRARVAPNGKTVTAKEERLVLTIPRLQTKLIMERQSSDGQLLVSFDDVGQRNQPHESLRPLTVLTKNDSDDELSYADDQGNALIKITRDGPMTLLVTVSN